MKITDFLPSPTLRPFIKCYRVVEGKEEITNRVLPGTSIAIAFRLAGQVSYASGAQAGILPPITLSGLRKSARLIHYSGSASTLVVLFREGAASAFFKEPLNELFEETHSLNSFMHDRDLDRLEEQMSEHDDYKKKAFVVDQFFLGRLCQKEMDNLVNAGIQKIKSANGVIRINELAEELSISKDAFEKRFRKIAGSSPKQFATIVRMSSVVTQLKQKPNLLSVAFDAGFYDQSHFIKTFREFTGQSPTEFCRNASHW